MIQRQSTQLADLLSKNAMYLAMGLAGLLVLLIGAFLGWNAWQEFRSSQKLRLVNVATDTLLEASVLQARERGLTAMMLGLGEDPSLAADLAELRTQTDNAWRLAMGDAGVLTESLGNPELLRTYLRLVEASRNDIDATRDRVDSLIARRHDLPQEEIDSLVHQWVEDATELIERAAALRDHLVLSVPQPPDVVQINLSVKQAVWRAAEHMGQLRALTAYYSAVEPTLPDGQWGIIHSTASAAERSINHLLGMSLMPDDDPRLNRALDELARHWSEHVGISEFDELATRPGPVLERHNPEEWFASMTHFIDEVLQISIVASEISQSRVDQTARNHILATAGYAALTFASGLLALLSLIRVRHDAAIYFQQRELADITLNAIGDAVIATDADARVEYLNPIARDLTGWSLDEAIGRPAREVFHLTNNDHESMIDPIGKCLDEHTMVGLTSGHVLVRRDGSEIPVDDTVTPLRNRDGVVIGAVVIFYDTSEEARQDHFLSYHARRDVLTGLSNRREFDRSLSKLLERARDNGEQHVLAYIDLDHFKLVNDSCGHTAGDRLLRQISFLLDKNVRETDTLARLGGDEFAVLLSRCDLIRAYQVADKLLHAIRKFRFNEGGRVFEIGASIGLAAITARSASSAEVLSEADAACYTAKQKGRNRIHVYQPDDMDLARRQGDVYWIGSIQAALHGDGFELHYQRIAPISPGLPSHVEILVRLPDESGELIAPGAFVPAAERYNLMPEIDHWIIQESTRFMARLTPTDSETVFNINLSGTTLGSEGLADMIRDASRQSGVCPSRLCFEITESAAIGNIQHAAELITELTAEGFRFALDDFGSGLASYSYLQTFPVQMLKIDGVFIRQLNESRFNMEMVRSTARIASILQTVVCAEFVEEESIIPTLRELGIDYVQGYAIHKPEPIGRFLP